MASEEKDLPLSVTGISYKVICDKHWCVSAIWLLSLQRFLKGAISRDGEAKKMHCEYKQLDRTFIQRIQNRVLIPQHGTGQKGEF